MNEKTFLILKPDAIERKLVGEIIKRIENKGLSIVDIAKATLEEEVLKEHYAHISHIPVFPAILNFMTCSPSLLLIVEGENAIVEMRRLMGSTFDALPGTIRGDFGLHSDCGANLIHGSDSPESAVDEINRFAKYF